MQWGWNCKRISIDTFWREDDIGGIWQRMSSWILGIARLSALVDDLDMSRAVVRTHNVRRMHLLASLLWSLGRSISEPDRPDACEIRCWRWCSESDVVTCDGDIVISTSWSSTVTIDHIAKWTFSKIMHSLKFVATMCLRRSLRRC